MRALVLLIALSLAAPAVAGRTVSLDPFEGNLGFAPEAPMPVAADHPLFRRVWLEEVQGMPRRIGSVLLPVTSAREFGSALRQSLNAANMLAASPQDARARLRVTWGHFDLPFRIGLTSSASVTVRYELSRIDDGRVIFSREIVTRAEARGGDGATRARGTGRAAISANLASAALCLKKAAVQGAPADCALRPTGRFSAPIAVSVPIYR